MKGKSPVNAKKSDKIKYLFLIFRILANKIGLYPKPASY